MAAGIFNDFFSNVITNLNLPPHIDPLINTENVEGPVLKAKIKFANHSNIKTIRDRFRNNKFSLNKVTKSDIRKEIINLYSVKASQDTQNRNIFTDLLHSAFNNCLEHVIYLSILKTADLIPVL